MHVPRAERPADQVALSSTALDPNGNHAAACNIGGGVTAIHDSVADVLYDAGRAAGYNGLREQIIAAFATPQRLEPRLDVELWGHSCAPDVLIDVTVCAPWAARYSAAPTKATTSAEIRKNGAYPATGGISVTGAAVDLLGRFGPQLSSLLDEWATLARTRDISRGVAPRRLLHAWRTRISALIARGVGQQIAAATRCTATTQLADPLTSTPAAQPAEPSVASPAESRSAAATATADIRSTHCPDGVVSSLPS